MRARGPGIAKTMLESERLDPDESASLVRAVLGELDALIDEHCAVERVALSSLDASGGEAQLIQWGKHSDTEILRIRWNHSEIASIEIDSRNDLSFEPGAAQPLGEVLEALLPMLWSHIRRGRALPEGIERFAGFLSLR